MRTNIILNAMLSADTDKSIFLDWCWFGEYVKISFSLSAGGSQVPYSYGFLKICLISDATTKISPATRSRARAKCPAKNVLMY